MIAVDTNILIYAHRAETDLHDIAALRLVKLAEGAERWALLVFCVTAFLRVVTHQRVFNPPSNVAQAIALVQGIASAPSCELIGSGPDFVEHPAAAARRANALGNLIFDAQIAALCHEHGVDTVLTNDRDFERFEP